MRSGGPCSCLGASTKSHKKLPQAGPWWAEQDHCCELGGRQRAGQGCGGSVGGRNWRGETSGERDGSVGVFARI